jgi:hypothetical protein
VAPVSLPLTLYNLDQLNSLGKDGEDIYLTSKDDISKTPNWSTGVLPDADGKTSNAVSSVVVVVEKGYGIVDAFYFYFYAYNWGGIVLGKNLGTCLRISHSSDCQFVPLRRHFREFIDFVED